MTGRHFAFSDTIRLHPALLDDVIDMENTHWQRFESANVIDFFDFSRPIAPVNTRKQIFGFLKIRKSGRLATLSIG